MKTFLNCYIVVMLTITLALVGAKRATAAPGTTGWCQIDVIRGGVPARIVKEDNFCAGSLVQAPAPSPTLPVFNPTQGPRYPTGTANAATRLAPRTITPWPTATPVP